MIKNGRENANEMAGKLLLFIIAPFLSFLYSLKSLKSRSTYLIFILFNLLFGLNFTVTNDRSAEHNLDGSLYRGVFENYCLGVYSSLSAKWDAYLGFDEETSKDIYVDIISFIVSRFTSNYHILFLVYAIVFTFFMAHSLKYLLKSKNFKNGSWVCFFLFILFIYNDIFNINGVRFWTAAWVAVYALFRIYVDKKKVYFALICITPLIHASYILFVLVSAIAVFFNEVAPRLKYLLLVSIFLSPLMVVALQSIDVSSMPAFFGRYMELYASEEALDAYGEKNASTLYYIIKTLFSVVSLLYINFLVLKIVRFSKTDLSAKPFSNFLVIFAVFCNLTMIIPSVGGRYIVLCYPIIAYLWLNVIGISQLSNWIKVLPLFFLLTFRSKLLQYTLVLDSDFYYMNLFSLIFKNLQQ